MTGGVALLSLGLKTFFKTQKKKSSISLDSYGKYLTESKAEVRKGMINGYVDYTVLLLCGKGSGYSGQVTM